MPEISQQQVGLLHHALGVTPERRQPFRDHYVAGPGHYAMADLEALETLGLVMRTRTPRFCDPTDVVFAVTATGKSLALRLLPAPPKRTKYDEYLRSEYSESFAEYLGINRPEYEQSYRHSGYEIRMYRRGYGNRPWIRGEWAPTKKEAKASYKAALKVYQEQCREWRKELAA